MKRVLFVINTLGGAGAEKALLELLKRFTQDRYEVDLYGTDTERIPKHDNLIGG